jgi:hypothetical protein
MRKRDPVERRHGRLAQRNGYYIAWENVSRADMLQASIGSFQGNTSKLAAIIPSPSCATIPRRNSSRKPPDPKQGPTSETIKT